MSVDGVPIEIERKYDVDSRAVLPSLIGVGVVAAADAPEVFDLDATYFDTAGLALAAAKIAVRRRTGGHDAGWHIKWPRTGEGRPEQQFPLGDRAEPPSGLRAALAATIDAAPLVPIARIRNRRAATVLRDASGSPLVELADDHVAAVDLLTGAERSWQEWEAELLPAAGRTREERDALLDAIEAVLHAAGARPPSSGSKLERALGR